MDQKVARLGKVQRMERKKKEQSVVEEVKSIDL